MEGAFLIFYVEEKQSHHGVLLWEWLLEKANKLGIRGGSAFRTIGGFGRRHTVHESGFFEQAGDTGIDVEFVVNDKETEQLLAFVRQEKIRVFYAHIPARFGVINPDARDTINDAAGK